MQHRPLSLMGVFRPRNDRSVDTLKWTASLPRSSAIPPLVWGGFIGISASFLLVFWGADGWRFLAGQALILVHLVALVAMVGGVLTR